MEWVETTGKTLDEAKEAALDELGVDEQDAEFEVLAEPKVGLFGRIRSEGRVRARVRPTTPRAKEDRRDRRRRSRSAAGTDEASTAEAPSDNATADAPADGERADNGGGRSNAGGGRQRPTKSTAPDTSSADSARPGAGGDEATPAGTARPGRSRSRRRGGGGQVEPATDHGTTDGDGASDGASSARRPARTRSEITTPRPIHVDGNDLGVNTEGVDMDVALDEQGDVATAFLTGLVERFGLTAEIDVQQPDDDTLNIALSGGDLGLLIGPKGATLLSIQDLTRTVVQRQTGAGNGRIYVDVSGYRQKRGEALARFTTKIAADVVASQQRVALEPMSAPDRKVVHDTATAIDGITTLSEGEDPRRRVVIIPTGD
jgi:spoIIIJ-associated protein